MRPLNKDDILTLVRSVKFELEAIEETDQLMAENKPIFIDEHFWFIGHKEEINQEVVEYTLTKPCKTLDEWELEHKPSHNIDPSNIEKCELKVATNSNRYHGLMECKKANRPTYHNDFWWTVKSVNHSQGCYSVLTLVDPIKDKETKVGMMTSTVESDNYSKDNCRGFRVEIDPISPKRDVIYIAGAISGDVIANRHKFAAAKHSILASSTNAAVLNPAELPDGLTQAQYMSICLPMVMTADTVYMLVGWEKSKGAVAEHALAEKLCINIEYQRQPGE